MRLSSLIATLVGGMMLGIAARAQQPQDGRTPFDRLFAAYATGDVSVIARTMTTAAAINALQPDLNSALVDPSPTRTKAMFLFDLATTVIAHKFTVKPAPDAPPFLEQVGTVWPRRVTPLGASTDDDAFEILFDKATVVLFQRELVDSTKSVDHYLDGIDERFARSPLARTRKSLDPRFALSRALCAEIVGRRRGGDGAKRESVWTSIPGRYDRATEAPDALPETLVRGALSKIVHNKPKDALTLLGKVPPVIDDRDVAYWSDLFGGQALANLDRPAEAAAAFEKALATAPHAQSATSALSALYLFWNNPIEAHRWSLDGLSAPATTIDPWWDYERGDERLWPAWIEALRKMVR